MILETRRVRCQLLDAKESLRMAPKVAKVMAAELGKDEAWQKQQIEEYEEITSNYILN